MRIFDTRVQELKYEVLKEIIRSYDKDELDNVYIDIPKKISNGKTARIRCCIYKERAILQERIKIALGGDKNKKTVVEVIDIACDECPVEGIFVSPACRGCIVHHCQNICPKDAIKIVGTKAVVDPNLCIECGKCVKACPYNAIIKLQRPCVNSCKVNAIKVNAIDKKAEIDEEKCINCGACVYQCPFGAITDKSYIIETLDILKESNESRNYKVYAIIAPSIVSQFNYAKIEQVVTGVKRLGFNDVVEVALGADIVLDKEIEEFKEKKIMTTPCCPSFVMYIEKFFPDLVQYISTTKSPMIETARLLKKFEPTCKVVFVGPCSAKKIEYKLERSEGLVDSVISFEELQAFLDARNIDVSSLEETMLNNASYYGRIFAKAGGITEGITKLAEARGVEDLRAIAMNGIDECKVNLFKLRLKRATANFFEGMACEGGCINGALCLHHGEKNAAEVIKYGNLAKEKTIDNTIKLTEL